MKKAALALIEHEGRVLCVWNKRLIAWALPGGVVEPGDDGPIEACARECSEEICVVPVRLRHAYDAPGVLPDFHVHVFVGEYVATKEARQGEPGCPIGWLTRDELCAYAPMGYGDWYRIMFRHVDQQEDAREIPGAYLIQKIARRVAFEELRELLRPTLDRLASLEALRIEARLDAMEARHTQLVSTVAALEKNSHPPVDVTGMVDGRFEALGERLQPWQDEKFPIVGRLSRLEQLVKDLVHPKNQARSALDVGVRFGIWMVRGPEGRWLKEHGSDKVWMGAARQAISMLQSTRDTLGSGFQCNVHWVPEDGGAPELLR
jgi:8-oxo-dGTP pyrophosphatase MutT (NUDIX family)